MRAIPYLCYGGVEISNGFRVATYVTNVGQPGGTMSEDCQCAQLDDGFDTPLTDPAPWYEVTRPESADFLGFYAENVVSPVPMSREVAQNGRRSSVLSPLVTTGRTIQVSGLMMARSGEGMAYGERWLTEALRGDPCDGDGIPDSDLIFLPACPELDSYDADRYFRTLVNVGLVDRPDFAPVVSKENVLQQASFVLVSSQPYLYHPATRCLDAVALGATRSCALTNPEWMGEGTYRIELRNTGASAATDIVITGQISLDGTCPVSGAGTSVPPTFSYTIPTLAAEDRIIIDGARRQVLHWGASEKYYKTGYRQITFVGPWRWPDTGVCTTMCLTISGGSSSVTATVDTMLREL